MKSLRIFAACVVGALVAACGSEPVHTPMDPDLGVVPLSDVVITGDIGPGSSYQIIVPAAWNGDLVLYAHGYVDPAGGAPLTEAEEELIGTLPYMGYAVAWSTYSEDGLAIKDAAQRTKQLRGLFESRVGHPAHTFLIGGSLGGLVVLDLVEGFPKHWDGALALCGMVGGTQAQIDYVAHVRVLFDVLYPGVLPGSLFDNPPLTPAEVAFLVGTAVGSDPVPAMVLGSVMQTTFDTPLPGASPDQILQSLVTALAFDVRGFADVLERTHGHVPFDNMEVEYVGSPDDILLNGVVARYQATPDARRYLDRHYQPSGALELPFVTLHNPFDPVVPVLHETLLGAAVVEAGASAFLDSRLSSNPFGHCDFPAAEVLGAFGAMVAAAGS